jgi:2-hydroxychromene-2-carboxylate isomerase
MAEPIEFFFDFSSPYGYIAGRLIDELGAKHGRTVAWKPILLGAIFKLTGSGPLTTIPLKGAYALHDFARTARLLGVPFKMPDAFPFSSVAAVRAFYWLDQTDPKAAHDLARGLYDIAFSGRDISAPATVAAKAAELGLDPDAVLAAIDSAPVKELARAENDKAVARGIFGSPFIVVDGEPFWGVDRLPQVERWLETGGW